MIRVLKSMGAKLAMAAFVLMTGGQALAAGSLAIDTLQGEKYGFSFNHPASDQADQRAMRECGPDCAVVLRFGGECAAYAADQAKGSNAYGWGTGGTAGPTQQRAMSECRAKGGSSCKVRSWGCDANKVAAAAQEPALSGRGAAQDAATRERPSDRSAAPASIAMLGEWLVDYVSSTGYTANGTMRVSENLGGGRYRGMLVLGHTSQGQQKRVQQDVMVTVQGDTVTVNASNPVYLLGQGNYNADNYTLTIGSANLLRGQNSDAKGAGGAVVVSRK